MVKFDEASAPTRREFCARCTKAAGLLAIGAAAGCGGTPTGPSSNAQSLPSVGATVSGRTVTVSMASSALASAGGMAITHTSIGNFLLTRTDASTVKVLTASCTHEGCTVDGFSGSQFVCPCHGAEFTTTGAVARGPANRSLQQYPSQVTGDTLTFSA